MREYRDGIWLHIHIYKSSIILLKSQREHDYPPTHMVDFVSFSMRKMESQKINSERLT